MPDRFALYYAPPTDHPLWIRAAQWLGRDAAGTEVDALAIGGLTPGDRELITTSARRYGFHATLKAPMALAPGATPQQLESAIEAFASRCPPPRIGRLVVDSLDGFLFSSRRGRAIRSPPSPRTSSPRSSHFALPSARVSANGE